MFFFDEKTTGDIVDGRKSETSCVITDEQFQETLCVWDSAADVSRCSLNCFGSCDFKHKGSWIKYLSGSYLSEKILQEANWTSKGPFSRWRKCQAEKRRTYTAANSRCFHAFHQMKDLQTYVTMLHRFPPSLLPNVPPHCLLLAHRSSPCFSVKLLKAECDCCTAG